MGSRHPMPSFDDGACRLSEIVTGGLVHVMMVGWERQELNSRTRFLCAQRRSMWEHGWSNFGGQLWHSHCGCGCASILYALNPRNVRHRRHHVEPSFVDGLFQRVLCVGCRAESGPLKEIQHLYHHQLSSSASESLMLPCRALSFN
jgi:hypothetical protein